MQRITGTVFPKLLNVGETFERSGRIGTCRAAISSASQYLVSPKFQTRLANLPRPSDNPPISENSSSRRTFDKRTPFGSSTTARSCPLDRSARSRVARVRALSPPREPRSLDFKVQSTSVCVHVIHSRITDLAIRTQLHDRVSAIHTRRKITVCSGEDTD